MRFILDIKNNDQLQRQFFINVLFALLFLFIARIISMYFIPLNDVSEARYGEIARKMLETGNWVTLQHDYGVPFWAKPPLSTWLSALSMKLFGVNEFAVRLPGLLLSLGVMWLIWDIVKKYSGSVIAALTVLVLAGTLDFFLDAGTVMTDPTLVFCIALIEVAFWYAMVDGKKIWSYVFFIGLGLGLLAKGPVAVVLPGMPIFFWVLLRNQWRNLWNKLPWITGILIMLAISLPWYLLAEIRTPGFLNYFIVGENINRFITPGWTGDKYGFAHKEHWGKIWIYAVAGIFPWSILGGIWFIKYRKSLPSLFRDEDGWLSYFFLCTVVSLFFFTFSSNIIYTYVFPSIPAFSVFFVEYWKRAGAIERAHKTIPLLSLVCGLCFLLATAVFQFMPEYIAKTQKPVVIAWLKQHPAAGSHLVYWDYKTEFSAQFYSAGKVKFALNKKDLCKLLSNNLENYVVINALFIKQLPQNLIAKLTQVQSFNVNQKKLLLMRSPVITFNKCMQKQELEEVS